MNKDGLSPLIDRNTRVLILGSFPSSKSFKEKQYYANPQNQFWSIMKEILKWQSIPNQYDKRCSLLLKGRIGLWDVFESCSRGGSSDNKIRNPKANKIDLLLKEYPQIKSVLCNGKKAYKFLNESCSIQGKYLPSSSPAHAMPFNIKVREWHKIKERK